MKTDLSLEIQKRLLLDVQTRYGSIEEIRKRIHSGDSELLQSIAHHLDSTYESVVSSLLEEIPVTEKLILDGACGQATFRNRVRQCAVEAIYGECLSPPLKIIPDLATYQIREINTFQLPIIRFKDKWIHAIIVEYLPNVGNEIYPLMIDAYVHDLSNHANARIAVICVHHSWLDDSLRITRGICFNEQADDIAEISLSDPIPIDSVQFLCISSQWHEKLSERFSHKKYIQLNPYPVSSQADNKYGCFQCWTKAGVLTPEAILIERDSTQDSTSLQQQLQQAFNSLFENDIKEEINLILQPNRGTEGRETGAFSGPRDWSQLTALHPDLIQCAKNILRKDDLLIRRGVGNLLFVESMDSEATYFDLRINVAGGLAESGFLMIAQKGQFISSPGLSGSIIELKHLMDLQFVVKGTHLPFKLDDDHWNEILSMAERAAACFPDCRLLGVDIRLEWNSEKTPPVEAYVLDINPRPAGLAHSRYLDTGETGVTQRLWDYLY